MVHFLKSLNWVDVLMLALAIRIIYTAIQTGFVVELMKLLAMVIALFLSLHYYAGGAAFIGKWVHLSPGLLKAAVLGLTWFLVVVLFKFIREGLLLVFTIQAINVVDRWGAALIAVARFFLCASLLLLLFMASDVPYLERITMSSFSQKYIVPVAPGVYAGITNGLVARFVPGMKPSPAVTEELNQAGK